MNYLSIIKLQKETGYNAMQEMINTGRAWTMEGTIGRQAMGALESGACMLPLEDHTDVYGNFVPSRKEIKSGTTGSYQNSLTFWSDFVACGYEFHSDTMGSLDANGDHI